LKRIEIIQDSIERNDSYVQIEELKEYFKDLNNETITIEIPQKQIPTPENIIQPLLWHQDKSENVQVIREEQDTRDLHNEIRKVEDPPQIRRLRSNEPPKNASRESTLKKRRKITRINIKIRENGMKSRLTITMHHQTSLTN
jgi:hypothetical protein